MSRKLKTIQKHGVLNEVLALDEKGPGNANHEYQISYRYEQPEVSGYEKVVIPFQKGPRNEAGSTPGVLDSDLLEVVRDRLSGFQKGPYACFENEQARLHVEEALMWLDRRVQDRMSRGVLGKNEE